MKSKRWISNRTCFFQILCNSIFCEPHECVGIKELVQNQQVSHTLIPSVGHSSLTRAMCVLSNKPTYSIKFISLLYAPNTPMPPFTHLWNGPNDTYKLPMLWGYSAVMHLQITTWKGNNRCVRKCNSITPWLAWHLSNSHAALGSLSFSMTLPCISCCRNRWHFDILHASNFWRKVAIFLVSSIIHCVTTWIANGSNTTQLLTVFTKCYSSALVLCSLRWWQRVGISPKDAWISLLANFIVYFALIQVLSTFQNRPPYHKT